MHAAVTGAQRAVVVEKQLHAKERALLAAQADTASAREKLIEAEELMLELRNTATIKQREADEEIMRLQDQDALQDTDSELLAVVAEVEATIERNEAQTAAAAAAAADT